MGLAREHGGTHRNGQPVEGNNYLDEPIGRSPASQVMLKLMYVAGEPRLQLKSIRGASLSG